MPTGFSAVNMKLEFHEFIKFINGNNDRPAIKYQIT